MAANDMKDHVIVCGYGLVGENVVDILLQHGIKVLVIDQNEKTVRLLNEKGVPAMEGDATSAKILRAAGIERARAIAIAMDDDAKNLFASSRRGASTAG